MVMSHCLQVNIPSIAESISLSPVIGVNWGFCPQARECFSSFFLVINLLLHVEQWKYLLRFGCGEREVRDVCSISIDSNCCEWLLSTSDENE